jgi:hypothetical protein
LTAVIRAVGIFALALALLGAARAEALTPLKVGEFDQPTYVTSDPGNAGRLFVVEREGTIELVAGGNVSQFADLSSKVQCGGACEGERGLMSIALAPDFDQSGRLYVQYANDLDGSIHVDELVAAGPAHASADPATLKPLIQIAHADAANHNGGQLQFGPDGALYASTGDGGGGDDQFHHSQDPASPLGKLLRLDPEEPGTYEIWSSGLRNPFRFSFDRLSGAMAIADVGQGRREEIDLAPSPFPGIAGGEGANYGWNCREGLIAGPATDPGCTAPVSFVQPVFDYPHDPDPDLGGANRCSITGGYVVRDAALGALAGHYVYGDYCSGVLRSLRLPASASGEAGEDCSLGLRLDHPVSFGEDAARRLYVVEQGGTVYRLTGLPPASCPAAAASAPPAPEQAQPRPAPATPTFVGIRAQRRRVERGRFALLTVWVSPCSEQRRLSVELLRNGRANGSRFLSRACTGRFVRRVRHGTTFRAATRGSEEYLPGQSRPLTVKLARRQSPRR